MPMELRDIYIISVFCNWKLVKLEACTMVAVQETRKAKWPIEISAIKENPFILEKAFVQRKQPKSN